MNVVQTKVRAKKIQERNLELRKQFWPEIKEEMLWYRKRDKGFTTIPRTMTYIMKIMDELSNGKPVSSTYFTLWCHGSDESFIKNDNAKELAFESGFRGERAETTWKSRMNILQELGFIDAKSGSSGAYNYVLIFNPYRIIKKHFESGRISQQDTYRAFLDRAIYVGAI